MCGRFGLANPHRLKAAGAFNAVLPDAVSDAAAALLAEPRFNIAPTQPVVAARTRVPRAGERDAQGGPRRPERRVDVFRWGLIPAWAKDPAIGGRLANARAETLGEKPSFRGAWRAARRCLVFADAFLSRRERVPLVSIGVRRHARAWVAAVIWPMVGACAFGRHAEPPRGGPAHAEGEAGTGSAGAAAPLAAAARVIDLDGLTAGDSAALDAFGRAVGDARVVMLGEPWHGDGGAIRARAGLVRYLHERLGFDVLAFEADFYSLNRGWRSARTPDEVRRFARENVYAFWGASRAAAPLWDYVAAQRSTGRPLEVTGFDVRHTGRLARTELAGELRRRLARAGGVAAAVDTAAFFATLDRLLTLEWDYKAPDAERAAFLSTLDGLARVWDRPGSGGPARDGAAPGAEGDDAFWAQEARNLAWAARSAWARGSRDRGMGEAFAWLATHRYPGRKVIVWAHNNHLIEDRRMYLDAPDSLIAASVARMPAGRRDSLVYFGDAVRGQFGEGVFTVATLSHAGAYSPVIGPALRGYQDRTSVPAYVAQFDSARALRPTAPGSLEAALDARGRRDGFCAAFLDLRPFRGRDLPVRTRALDYAYSDARAMRYWVGYDAFLVLGRTTGLEQPAAVCVRGGPPRGGRAGRR